MYISPALIEINTVYLLCGATEKTSIYSNGTVGTYYLSHVTLLSCVDIKYHRYKSIFL